VKRHLPGPLVALALVAAGVLTSACDVTPPAATANGTTISVASLNSQLSAYENTEAGQCLLQLNDPTVSLATTTGDGGSGTYSMTYANAVLEVQIQDLLAVQFAKSKGLDVTTSDLSTAKNDVISSLNGEISSAVQDSSEEGTTSPCETAAGQALSAATLLSQLPAAISSAEVLNEAYDEKLLANGANLSAAAIFDYYAANKAQFTLDCVSRIVTTTEAKAKDLMDQLNAGASFSSLARSNSVDTESAAVGGSIGCSFPQAEVEQQLGLQSLPVGQALGPIQGSSAGEWFIYEVTSQTVEPLSAARTLVQRELLQATANIERVNKEIVAFAHRSRVSIDPQYGNWNSLNIAPPVAPQSDLLPSGTSVSTAGAPLTGTGSTGTGSGVSGASSTSNG
jgi:hypothetical protein